MAVDSTHPDYDAMLSKWERVRDALDGDRVKDAGDKYLPRLSGMTRDDYAAYKKRGLYYGATARTLQGVSGLVFRRDTMAQIPASTVAEELVQDVSIRGVSYDRFAQMIFDEAFSLGRVGIYVSMPATNRAGQRAYVTRYRAENIVNWSEEEIDGRMVTTRVVLKERRMLPDLTDPYKVKACDQYRDVYLEDGALRVVVWRKSADIGVRAPNAMTWIPVEEYEPRFRGARLTYVPFWMVNARSIGPQPEDPPLLPLADANLDHYRLMTDYRHGLHYTALPTPYVFGGSNEDELRIGSGTAWTGGNSDVKVGMLEFTGAGLGALSEAISDSVSYMASLGARLIEAEKQAAETAETHRLRQGRDQATVAGCVQNVNAALSDAVTLMLNLSGVPGEAVIEANTDIVDAKLAPDELRVLVEAYQTGAMSFKTFYHNLQRGEMTRAGVDVEEEREEIEATAALQMAALPPAGEPFGMDG